MADETVISTDPPSENWRYSNLFRVAVTGQEVVIDFAHHFEGPAGPHWHTRIVLLPRYAQELLAVLSSALNSPSQPMLH